MKLKRYLSIFMAMGMLVSTVPSSAFADENGAVNIETENSAETDGEKEENEQEEIKEEPKAEENYEIKEEPKTEENSEAKEEAKAEEKDESKEEKESEKKKDEEEPSAEKEENEINDEKAEEKGIEEEQPFTEEMAVLSKTPKELSLDEQAEYYMFTSALNSANGIALFSGETANETLPVFKISSADQLTDLAEKIENSESYWGGTWAEASYEQISNINLSGTSWKGIGTTSAAAFKGKYNGKGYSITNLNAERGIFGYVTNGTVENLAVKNCTINGRSNVGAVAGIIENATIKNCWTSGSVTTNGNCGGGIAGSGSSGIIENCYSLCSVSAASTAGGIAGELSATEIKNCVFLGKELTAATAAYRIAKDGIPSDNYAWKETAVKGSTVSGGTADNASGEDITFGTSGFSKSFAEIFNNDVTWNYSKDLPVLANDTPGSNFPEYLYTNAVMGEFKGKGTEEEPYLIESRTDLINFRNKVNGGSTVDDKTGGNNYSGKYFKQTADIDLSGEDWIPIANSKGYNDLNNSFQGIYDGGGYIIKNLTVKNDNVKFAGLFGFLKENSVIKNLGVENCNIQTKYKSGYAGAIVGATNKGQGIVQNCYSTGTVYGEWSAGGIIGSGGKKVTNCFSLCDVSLKERIAGGIVGGADGGVAYIENCIFLGRSVSGKKEFTSDNGPYTSRIACNTKSKHTNNYAWNKTKVNEEEISQSDANYGADKSHGANLTYDSVNKLSKQFSAIFGDIDGESADSVWNFEDNMLPTLKNENVTRATSLPSWITSGSTAVSADFAGKGTAEAPYLIQSKDDLMKLKSKVNDSHESYAGKYFKQSANIDLSGINWIPIACESSMPFKGIYDGGGYEISNLKNDRKYEGGLFGYLSGTVKNLAIINCDVSYSNGNGYSGAVVASGGTVINCYSTGKVSGKQCGGISGNGSTITNCYSTAKVTGTDSSYGIGANPSKISGCIALNNEISGTSAGRIGSKQTLTNNYALKEMNVNNAAVTMGNSANGINGADLTVGNGKLYKSDGTEFNWNGYDTNVWTIPSESGVLPYLAHSSKVALNMGEQKTANITLDTSVQKYTYNKIAKEFELKNVNPSGITVKVEYRKKGTNDDFSTTAPINAGSYDVRLTSDGGKDISPYNNVITDGLVIEKAERKLEFISPIDNNSYAYTDRNLIAYLEPRIRYEDDGDTEAGSMIVKELYRTDLPSGEQYLGTDLNRVLYVGSYKLVASIPERGNYKADSTSVNFKITKADNYITAFEFADGWVYGDKTDKTPVAISSFGKVKFKYSSDGNTWFDEQPTEVGSYKIKAYVDETDNFAGVEQTKDFKITQAFNTVESLIFSNSFVYGKTDEKPVATATFGTVKFKYSSDGGKTWFDEQPTDVGSYKIKAYVEETNNYKYAELERDFKITQAKPSVTEIPTSKRIKKGSKLSVSTFEGGKVEDLNKKVLTGSWTWKNGEEIMNTVGDFSKTAVFTPDNKNYGSVETEVNVTVFKRSSGGGSIPTCTVKFETDDENFKTSDTIGMYEKLKEPKNPEKEGYTFDGWYTDEECTQKYDFDTRVNKDFTLYAKWVKNEKVDENNQIILKIGEKEAEVFGKTVKNDVSPVIVNSRTMLPARFVAEALGAKVYWDAKERKVTIINKKDDKNTYIVIYIGSDKAYVNEKEVELDSTAFIANDRTYLPVRFICEELGADVKWLESELKIVITKK